MKYLEFAVLSIAASGGKFVIYSRKAHDSAVSDKPELLQIYGRFGKLQILLGFALTALCLLCPPDKGNIGRCFGAIQLDQHVAVTANF